MIRKLVVTTILCSIASISCVPYNNLRSNFKENMYKKQSGLMSHKAYMQFLEEHLLVGEKTLVIPRTALAQKATDASDLERYFDLLVKINTAMFFHLVKPNSHTVQSLRSKKALLLEIIQGIKVQWNLPHLDPEIELQNTITFFNKSTQDFYNKLSAFARIKASAAALLPRRT